MMCEEADRELLYQQKLEAHLTTKKLFLSLVGSENRNLIEDYIDVIF